METRISGLSHPCLLNERKVKVRKEEDNELMGTARMWMIKMSLERLTTKIEDLLL